MDKTLEQQYPRLFKSYWRATIAHPEGSIVHDGDCDIFNEQLGICTCGLHHRLMPINHEDRKNIYPEYDNEIDGKFTVEVIMREHIRRGIWVECEICGGTGDIKKRICKECEGKGLVRFSMPEKVNSEEVEKLIEDMFKGKDND